MIAAVKRRQIDTFNIGAYLIKSCRHVCLKILVKNKNRHERECNYLALQGSAYLDDIDAVILANDILAYIKMKHGEEAAELFDLKFNLNYTYEELAKIKKAHPSGVWYKVHKSIKTIKDVFPLSRK